MVDVKQEGRARYAPCCHFDENIELEEFEQKTKLYLERLKNDEKIPQCKHCWNAEKLGLRSIRQASLGFMQDYDDVSPGIKIMDIRIHNKCNLACTMCYSGASNLWGKLEGKDTLHSVSEEELSIIKEKIKNVVHISFQGGEPFYGSEYDDFLMSLDNLENITVDIFTNVISAKREVIERWNSKLKGLRINASVDGYGDVYESIRWPTTWSKFEKNAKMIYSILDEGNMSYFWALQAENASNIFEFLEWRDKNTPKSRIEPSIIVGSSELGLDYMDMNEKNKFISSYQKYIKTKDKRYFNGYFRDEYLQLKSIYKMVSNIQVKNELIAIRKNKLEHINLLRKNYKEK